MTVDAFRSYSVCPGKSLSRKEPLFLRDLGYVVYAELMRAYKFLSKKWGLAALQEKRLKVSRICDLNDPFELTPFNLSDASIRKTFLKTRDEVGKERGLLCFSSGWSDPVIWAHYSEKHYGLCLGFEIPELKADTENDDCGKVDYIQSPLQFSLEDYGSREAPEATKS